MYASIIAKLSKAIGLDDVSVRYGNNGRIAVWKRRCGNIAWIIETERGWTVSKGGNHLSYAAEDIDIAIADLAAVIKA